MLRRLSYSFNYSGEDVNMMHQCESYLIFFVSHLIFFDYVFFTGSDKDGDKVITNHVCQHGGKSWPYWFRKMGMSASSVSPCVLLLLAVNFCIFFKEFMFPL